MEKNPEIKKLNWLKNQVQRCIRRYRTEGGRRNLLAMAAYNDFHPLAVSPDRFDRKSWLLGCDNGIINLKTGDMEPPHPDDYVSRAVPHPIDFSRPTPHWDQFLFDVLVEPDVVEFARRLFGAMLLVALEFLVFWVGFGRNGKSTLKEIFLHVLGPLAAPIPSEMLIDSGRYQNSAGPRPDIASLRVLSMGFATETDEEAKIAAGPVKTLTGNDTLTARHPYDRLPVTFQPRHNINLLTNNLPKFSSNDPALWARVILLNFPTKFVRSDHLGPGQKTLDPKIKDKLKQEAPGILAWLVHGCLEYQAAGMDLRVPVSVRAGTEEYRQDEDVLGTWILECCEIAPNLRTPAGDLYENFKAWYEKNAGKDVPSQKKFGGWLRRKFQYKRGQRIEYIGISLQYEPW